MIPSLLCSQFGPFHPNVTINVPLWLALALKKRGSCTIILQPWFQTDKVGRCCMREKHDKNKLQLVPFHYVETAHTVSKYLKEDMPQEVELQSYLDDIISVRQNKIRELFCQLTRTDVDSVLAKGHKLNQETSGLELNMIRSFVCSSMDSLNTFFLEPEVIEN